MCLLPISIVLSVLVFFFFSSRRRHTRFDCDWSSDVCSSDLMAWHAGIPRLCAHNSGAQRRTGDASMHIGQRFWRRQGLGAKLSLTNFVWVAAILALLVLGIAWDVSKSLQKKMHNEMQQGVQMLQ